MQTMMNKIEHQYRKSVSVSSSPLPSAFSSSHTSVSQPANYNLNTCPLTTTLLLSSLLLSCCCCPTLLSAHVSTPTSTTAPLLESSHPSLLLLSLLPRLPLRSLLLGLLYCFFHYQSDDSTIIRFQEAISTSQYPSTDFFVMDYFYFDYYYFIKK